MAGKKDDLPYYAGQPVAISGAGWLVVTLAVIAAFLQLVLSPFNSLPWIFIPALVFTGLPLLALMAVTGWRAPAVFRPLGLKQFGIGIAFASQRLSSQRFVVSWCRASTATLLTRPLPALAPIASWIWCGSLRAPSFNSSAKR